MDLLKGRYGYFSDGGKTYTITDWRTPKPWINVISNGRWGLTVSQAGSGYSWLVHSMLHRITRWDQDLLSDNFGKYFFVRDNTDADVWSVTPLPLKPALDGYRCVHGPGFTRFFSEKNGLQCALTVFVPPGMQCEVWEMTVKNTSRREKMISVFSYLEPLLGVFPSWHREFHKIFIKTYFLTEHNALIAEKTLWTAPLPEYPGWNKEWPYSMFFFSSRPPDSFECSREKFIGPYNTIGEAAAFSGKSLSNTAGTGFDPAIAFQFDVSLAPGGEEKFVFCLGAVEKKRLKKILPDYVEKVVGDTALLFKQTGEFWDDLCGRLTVKTPDPALDVMVNYWLKYQTISCRLLGRSAYYQCGGAFGFRDQLQDSQVYLSLDPARTRDRIIEHSKQQQTNGTVRHWWHPVTDEGRMTEISDDLLWLPFITFKYLDETGDMAFLELETAFFDKGKGSIFRHCEKAIDRVLSRRSKRGLALIGEGDWNDGMNGAGPRGEGESVWLSMFLYGVVDGFIKISRKIKKSAGYIKRYEVENRKIKQAIMEHGFDGKWFIRATTDAGRVLGSRKNRTGKLFLNPQTWAVMNAIVDQEQAKKLLEQVEKHLYRDYGILLFTPAFDRPDRNIGYLSRYAPGIRENGGVYTHAAVWTIIAQAMAGNSEKVYDTFKRLCPPFLSNQAPDIYMAEPYVTPGNIEGPESPFEGKGAWTWYTGSAAWLYTAAVEYVLGVRVEDDRLVVEPNIPSSWDGFSLDRIFRGEKFTITVKKKTGKVEGEYAIKIRKV